MKGTDPIRVMKTPLVFHLTLGKQIREIEINQREMRKILLGKHQKDNAAELIKKIPEALTNPIFIFERKAVRANEYDVIVDLQNANGDYYLVRILADRINTNAAIVDKIGTIHPKENFPWYRSNFRHDQLLYVGTKKGIKQLSSTGLLSSPAKDKVNSFASTVPLSVMDVKQEIR